MASAVTSIYNNVISAASAGFAPTNSADVSAIASAYQVVSATATQLYAGSSYVTSINDVPFSASRAGNAANASMANSAYYDGTGRFISALPDSATVSAIASAYAESAASGKQDELTFGYNSANVISSIDGSALAGGGGGEADWSAESGQPGYIENKPVPKTLVAGANISISEGQNTLTISAAAGLPASTSADEGKCLVVDSNGDPEWGTGGKTYTGTDGVVVDNVNDTVGLEAPVDIVAGPGIVIDNPDGNTLRVSTAQDVETVLWENYTFANNKAASVAMSETPFNFSQVRITFYIEESDASWGTLQTQLIDMVALASNTNKNFTLNGTVVSGGTILVRGSRCSFNGTSITEGSTVQWYNGGSGSMSNALHIYRIVGIHRIANN